MRTYALMHRNKPGSSHLYTITVPAYIGRACVKAERTLFTAEATDDGILYRPVSRQPEPEPELPAWLTPKGAA